jgi:hypothetical protein
VLEDDCVPDPAVFFRFVRRIAADQIPRHEEQIMHIGCSNLAGNANYAQNKSAAATFFPNSPLYGAGLPGAGHGSKWKSIWKGSVTFESGIGGMRRFLSECSMAREYMLDKFRSTPPQAGTTPGPMPGFLVY